MKEKIIEILKEASLSCDDGFGGSLTGVFDDSFDEVADDIISLINIGPSGILRVPIKEN